jgi:Asp-tRNA(Asn)/Glu-tRNA(Gln) amidotransferase A subunit family amidase
LFRAAMMAIPYVPPAMPETAPRLGLCRGPHWDEAQPEGRAVLEAATDRLASAGAAIRDTELPAECAEGEERQTVIGSFEGLRNHMPELYRHEALLSTRLRETKIARGRELSLVAFRRACRGAEGRPGRSGPWSRCRWRS